ncbi:ATP-binding cassette domain-containing protein [Sulfurimonas lithotrophica]|uniref:ATP-binding cassette domain-containing protein n=1 Tax=Sulfurimonas lithotrophica TaxID=2590022 RepID=A0A5P8NYG9_9BACT|nr:ATP-binding cassette domain-containing protein [Sulfurimonas lithotrophica]QFR48485.1 ATP-binding cassette domain-containing protein [Sulfurimonas lithotrophica]
MNLLKANNLSHSFDTELFSNVSLNLDAKQSMAIIGLSGSGKSTLLNILSTLLVPSEGEVYLFGKNVTSMKEKELERVKRKDLGLVFQQHYLFRGFSVEENLEISAILSDEDIDKKLLKRLGVENTLQQKVTELSGGQQQRISIARVLTKKPKILFVDEPTGNLDNVTGDEVKKIFFDYIDEEEAGMVLVTHNEEFAMDCNIVYKLQNKELVRVK